MAAHYQSRTSVSKLFWTFVFISFTSNHWGRGVHATPSDVATRQEDSAVDCLTGKVPFLTSSSKGYADYASPYNLRFQYKPTVIVLAETSQHVSDSVLCASKLNLKVQANSGGHSCKYLSYFQVGR